MSRQNSGKKGALRRIKVHHGGETARPCLEAPSAMCLQFPKPNTRQGEITIPVPVMGLSCPLQRQLAVLDFLKQVPAPQELQNTAPACSKIP